MRAVAIMVVLLAACEGRKHDVVNGGMPAAAKTRVKLCDDHTTVDLDTLPADRAGGQAVADALMAQWRQKHPDTEWEQDVRRSWTVQPPADNNAVLVGDQR